MYMIPEVNVSLNGSQRTMSTLSRELMLKRTIYLNGEVTDDAALSIITQMHYLEDISEEPIILMINSPGGSVSAGLAIYDTMNVLRCPVATAAMGLAASMGAVLLAAGTKGYRRAAPSSRIMIHQPFGAAQGQATDIQIAAENIQRTKRNLAGILAVASDHSVEEVLQDCERDSWMNANEAYQYGLIDAIGFPRGEKLEVLG